MTQATKTEQLTSGDRKRLERLYEAFLKLRSKEEVAAFMRDLCTLPELKALSERLAIAELLSKDVSYRGASDALLASTTTVTRVAHWLNHGTGGYRTVLQRMKR